MSMQVFISHDGEDAGLAHRLAADLRQLQVPVWIAPDSIRPGEDWVDAISRGLGESSHLLLVLTPAAVASRWVRTETNVAIQRQHRGQMTVIPLDVSPCKAPLVWTSYQMVSFRRGYEKGFRKLTQMLVGARPVSVPSVERPARWSPAAPTDAGRPSVMAQFRVLLADISGVDPASIQSQSSLAEDLELDELDQVQVLMAVEDEWGLEISDAEALSMTTVADWVSYLSRLGTR